MRGRSRTERGGANRGRRRGFTLIEAIVIIVILGVIAAVVAPRLLGRIGQSKQSVAAQGCAALATQMKLYMADCGSLEAGTPLSVLLQRPGNVAESAWKGPYVDNEDSLKDPWGNPYLLVVPGQVNVDFDIVSYGSDGQPGGEGENEDVVNGKRRG